MNVDFGYTGHYLHAPSNLYLALFRSYEPSIGRWLSRDPIAGEDGSNLYGYVLNNPVQWKDSLGLQIDDSGTHEFAQALARGNAEEIQMLIETQPSLTPELQAAGRAAVQNAQRSSDIAARLAEFTKGDLGTAVKEYKPLVKEAYNTGKCPEGLPRDILEKAREIARRAMQAGDDTSKREQLRRLIQYDKALGTP